MEFGDGVRKTVIGQLYYQDDSNMYANTLDIVPETLC